MCHNGLPLSTVWGVIGSGKFLSHNSHSSQPRMDTFLGGYYLIGMAVVILAVSHVTFSTQLHHTHPPPPSPIPNPTPST